MKRARLMLAPALCLLLLFVRPSEADDGKQTSDLTVVIPLHGLQCGKVVAVAVRGANDFDASCEDGNRYRVYVNAEGRVVVEKQSSI